MPDVTLSIPSPIAARIKVVQEDDGIAGGSAAHVAEFKRRLIQYGMAWLQGREAEMAEKARVIPDGEIT